MGRLMFLVFINDLPEHLPGIGCYAFADDFKMLVTDDETMKRGTTALDKWCSDNSMELNAKKCSILDFKGRAKAQLSGVDLDHPESTRDLGVIISNHLTWDSNLGAFFSIRLNLIKHSNTALKTHIYTAMWSQFLLTHGSLNMRIAARKKKQKNRYNPYLQDG